MIYLRQFPVFLLLFLLLMALQEVVLLEGFPEEAAVGVAVVALLEDDLARALARLQEGLETDEHVAFAERLVEKQ